MRKEINQQKYIPAYEGMDMAGFMMEQGFKFSDSLATGKIMSITNIRDMAIIVTERRIYRARPERQVGFCIECLFNNL